MGQYLSNYDIAQEISARIGNSPIPFDSVYSICLEIYRQLGGEEENFDSVYSILLEILPLVEGGGANVIDDTSIRLDKTWSSEKINSEISALAGTSNSEIEGKQTEDFTFVVELPASGEEDEQVIIKGENADTLYKYVSGSWVEQTPDATKLYFDTENEALYSYVSADHQFAPVSMVNTIVVGSNLNTNTALKAIKTPGVYSVVQRLHSSTKGDYIKNWTLTVEGIDYDEYERTDSIYQRIQSNYTIQKRTWSSTRATNDGWSSFSTYYAGEIKDSTVSKYYTWSSNKLNASLGAKQDVLNASNGILIDASNNIALKDFIIDDSSLRYNYATYYRDDEDNGAIKQNVANGDYSNWAEGSATTATSVYGGNHAEGYGSNASGSVAAHAEGAFTTAAGDGAHAEGWNTEATGIASHAEGCGKRTSKVIASGDYSHAEGWCTQALGNVAHVEGYNTIGYAGHIEGYFNIPDNTETTIGSKIYPSRYIHIAGNGYNGNQSNAYTLGLNGKGWYKSDVLCGGSSEDAPLHRLSNKQDILTAGDNISIENNKVNALGYKFANAFIELPETITKMEQQIDPSQVNLNDVQLSGAAGATTYSYSGTSAEYFGQIGEMLVESGIGVQINGVTAFIQSVDSANTTVTLDTTLDANNAIQNQVITAFVQNISVLISGAANTTTYTVNDVDSMGIISVLSDYVTKNLKISVGSYPLMKVISVNTSNNTITLESTLDANNAVSNAALNLITYNNNIASNGAHAEGKDTEASGIASHTEGYGTKATGRGSHSEGIMFGNAYYVSASGDGAHAEGECTVAQNKAEHAEGRFNKSHKINDLSGQAGNTQHSIGIGDNPADNRRKNAFEVMQNGDMYVLGVGGYQGTDTKVQNASIQTLQEVVNGKQDTLAAGQNISIDASNNISADGYKYYPDIKSTKTIAKMTSTTLINKYSEDGNIIDLPSGKNEGFVFGSRNVLKAGLSTIIGNTNTIESSMLSNFAVGKQNTINGGNSAIAVGLGNTVNGGNSASVTLQYAIGSSLIVNNHTEGALGQYNISHNGNTDDVKTRFSIGDGKYRTTGEGDALRENIIEVMNNGDMYLRGVGGYDGVHVKSETGYENTKTLQEYIAALETKLAEYEARIAALEGNTPVE